METVNFDEEYVKRLSDGDSAVEQHFADYFGELLRIKLRSRVRSPQLLEDVKQETFLRVIKNLRNKGIDHPERLGAYVNSVCNNVLFEAFRAESRFTEMNDESTSMIDPKSGVDEAFLTRERQERVSTLMKELPEKDRQLLQAVFLEEQDKDEVCRRFGVDRNYLRVLLHRARQKFRSLCSEAHFAAH